MFSSADIVCFFFRCSCLVFSEYRLQACEVRQPIFYPCDILVPHVFQYATWDILVPHVRYFSTSKHSIASLLSPALMHSVASVLQPASIASVQGLDSRASAHLAGYKSIAQLWAYQIFYHSILIAQYGIASVLQLRRRLYFQAEAVVFQYLTLDILVPASIAQHQFCSGGGCCVLRYSCRVLY